MGELWRYREKHRNRTTTKDQNDYQQINNQFMFDKNLC